MNWKIYVESNIKASKEPCSSLNRNLQWLACEPDFLVSLYSEEKHGKIQQTTGLKEISLAHQSILYLVSLRSIRHGNVRDKSEKGNATVAGTVDNNNIHHMTQCA